MQALSGYPLPALDTPVCQRVGFAESAAQGATVLETDPTGTAAREIRALVKAIEQLHTSAPPPLEL